MACTRHKAFSVGSCPDNIIIKTLAPSTSMEWRLTNRFGKVYKGIATTDIQGALTIPVADPLSKDFFQPFSGAWLLELYKGSEQVIFCGIYDYLAIGFHRESPAEDNAIIDLKCGS